LDVIGEHAPQRRKAAGGCLDLDPVGAGQHLALAQNALLDVGFEIDGSAVAAVEVGADGDEPDVAPEVGLAGPSDDLALLIVAERVFLEAGDDVDGNVSGRRFTVVDDLLDFIPGCTEGAPGDGIDGSGAGARRRGVLGRQTGRLGGNGLGTLRDDQDRRDGGKSARKGAVHHDPAVQFLSAALRLACSAS
jgi:hypothetical protein